MTTLFRKATLFFLAILLLAPALLAQSLRDGTFFEHGSATTTRSDGAPEVLDKMTYLLGQWDVEITTYPADATPVKQPAQAVITYMNRGHAFMERLHAADFDGNGHELNTITFLVFTPGTDQWAMGLVDSYTENVTMYNGDLQGDDLTLYNALRHRGGVLLTYYRTRYTRQDADHFTLDIQTSPDGKTAWMPALKKSYSRRETADGFLAGSSEFGSPAPDLPKEARQFDFLVGIWDSQNQLTFPNGQTAKWPATTTGGYVLNGHAIMEYNWFDLDSNLPDAATTIVRIYNRAMRRWESLYLANRGNSPLYFGGRQEGDRMVLHTFEANASDRISRFVFHDIKADSYRWYGEASTDRGQTFTKNWIIDVTRQE
ncbi:MAG TPA: DUF1579 family protein [Rhodothermales bacterium]|nr:DUF1579 family protein [Rhodothermales bacterium]